MHNIFLLYMLSVKIKGDKTEVELSIQVNQRDHLAPIVGSDKT